MMRPEIRKQRIEAYGSFLHCPQRGNLCFGIDTPDGTCKHQSCILDDPEYVKRQQEIDIRIQENAEKERLSKLREDDEKPAPIDQKKELAARVERMELAAQRAYKRNNPKEGDRLMQKALYLQAQLNRERKRAR